MKVRFEVETPLHTLIDRASLEGAITDVLFTEGVEISLPGNVVLDIAYTVDMDTEAHFNQVCLMLESCFEGFKVKNFREVH